MTDASIAADTSITTGDSVMTDTSITIDPVILGCEQRGHG
jgi:hypothetical protein